MKPSNLTKYAGLGLAALALALPGNLARAASDIIIGPAGSEANINNNDGEWQNMWGPAFANITFDPATPPPTGDTQGSIYVQGNWPGTDADNYCIGSAGNWWGAVTFDGSQYASIELDIKYDTTSTMAPAGNPHVQIGFDSGYSFSSVTNVSFATGQAIADGNWHHLSIPIPATMGGISAAHSLGLYQWNPSPTAGTMSYWVANAVFKARVVPVAPPLVNVPTKATTGLNVFASTEGNSFYDRQEVELMQSSGLSWVNHATTANPVTYSFTIVGYPTSQNCEAWMFLAPNPAGNDNSPDWNETNCAIFYLQGSPTNVTAHFQYKVNEDHQQAMYSAGNEARGFYTNAPGSWNGSTTNYLESGNLATMTGPGILGTWTLKFTSDTNGTIIAPNGSSTNFVIPPYNVSYFAESNTPAFNVYLGMQANNADAMNQAVVYGDFAVSNTAQPFSENFLTDTVLDTTNIWRTTVAGGPKGVLIVPANASKWISWALPDTGFSLQIGAVLNNPLGWYAPTAFPSLVPLYGMNSQLLATSDLPPGPTAFFDLIKRVGTQLQILFPGETNAPNTLTGKTGTPATGYTTTDQVNVTINLVDSTFHIVNSTDALQLSSSDTGGGFGFLTATPSLAGGTVTVPTYFDSGSWTVSAADTTTPTITSGTSASINIQ